MEGSILASASRPLWRYLQSYKIDADALFRRSGLDPALLREPRTRYPFKLICDAWLEASVATQNDNMGFECARFYTPLDLNALGVTFLSSATLIEALQRLLRYEKALNSSLIFSIEESRDSIDLKCEVADMPPNATRFVEDCRTAVLIDLCRQGVDTTLDPLEVSFSYPEPKAIGEHFAAFRCLPKFSQPVSKISFNKADVQLPFSSANRDIALSSDHILDGIINDLNQSDIISRVKRAIIDDLPSGTPGEEDIAKRLFVSSRTLQRKLSEENTNFRTLILEVRREIAEHYLADESIPLAEISYMLGFSDSSSFSRAFKKWTGEPPAVFRTNLAGA